MSSIIEAATFWTSITISPCSIVLEASLTFNTFSLQTHVVSFRAVPNFTFFKCRIIELSDFTDYSCRVLFAFFLFCHPNGIWWTLSTLTTCIIK
jgi:hypothetical protein